MSSDKKTGHEIPNGHVPRQGALATGRKNLEKYFLNGCIAYSTQFAGNKSDFAHWLLFIPLHI